MHGVDLSPSYDDVEGGLAVNDDEVHIQASLSSAELQGHDAQWADLRAVESEQRLTGWNRICAKEQDIDAVSTVDQDPFDQRRSDLQFNHQGVVVRPGDVFLWLSSAGFHILFQPVGIDRHHDLCVKVAAVDSVVPVVFVKLAVPIPVLHVLRDARFGRVFEDAPVPVLEVDHVDLRVELILRQRVAGRLSPLAIFLTASNGSFLFRSRPLVRVGVCTGDVVIAAEVLGAFWWLSSTLNTPSDFAWMSAISYRRLKRRWSDSIDPGCRLLMNEPAAWTESAL
ncbi:hypothetical protein PanWU01x14_030070 [Parasponia andersonii]|uniref:Uncharacterized protein n=1 Tax=Parasponia andersonii TaxID=3476 RepID=A0A2P5DUM8_PARAD|nr:hypothetical protein PanWU01x14_030070 [Parasponia andersonii]